MKVFKFGGASLKNAQTVRDMAAIVKANTDEPLVIVVSAMAKTTNALERILNLYASGTGYQSELTRLAENHKSIIIDLFANPTEVIAEINTLISTLADQLKVKGDPDEVYDRIVSFGEIISSRIVFQYLSWTGIACAWKDARQYIRTDNSFREGKVNWIDTKEKINSLREELQKKSIITQGFISSTIDGLTTTLGREGSDYTAAIFASCLQVEQVTIWKDVPGVMNADPKRLPAAIVFDELPYKEASEMTYYGASVIHPKTIKPLALMGIPLYVKSFADPSLPGTKIHECKLEHIPPMIVFKDNQCLISCKVTDYTFINEQQLSIIFHALSDLNIKLNVMQNSAISFSFCVDYREHKVTALIERLHEHFEVYYNTNLTLITIKNYDEHSFESYRKRPDILMEQSSRSTLQVLVKV